VPNASCVLAGGVHADSEEAPASALSTSACCAVPETSAVQQPVLKVHSKVGCAPSLRLCASG
jgi:hypothetical protein